MSVAGLLLAAGAGRRYGGPKALAVYDGRLLVERAAAMLSAGGCTPVHVVLGAAAREIEDRADLTGAVVVGNADWASGMGSSLRAGLRSLPQTADAVVVALVDQPLIGAEAVRRLRSAFARGARIAVATYDDRPGHPVLFAHETWPGVSEAAHQDAGARAYLRDHPEEVTYVDCTSTGSPVDVDTPADLTALRPHG
ncbi:MAG: NTP transferase domain-containing protein [Propionibacteriales bacterium]|nr:NTP transferase domain-containing protein [Propionibacteriales bacterium]